MSFENKYPYTDFHELNLDWFLARFKTVMDEWTQMKEDFHTLEGTVQEFTEFVTNYFDNLDVQEEINNKLDVMAEDGTLSSLIQPLFDEYKVTIDGIVATQNSTIMTQNDRIQVLESRMDTFASLEEGSTTGDAELMDARIGFQGLTYASAGDAIRAEDQNLFTLMNAQNLETIAFTEFNGYYYIDSSAYLPTVTANNNYNAALVACNPGDVFTISLSCSTSLGSYAFYTAEDAKICQRKVGSLTNEILVAPFNAAKLVFNTNDKTLLSYKGIFTSERISNNTNLLQKVSGLVKAEFMDGFYVNYNNGVVTNNSSYRCSMGPCNPGDSLTITGNAGNAARLYQFFDSSMNPLIAQPQYGTVENLIVTAPDNAAYYAINDNDKTTICYLGAMITPEVPKASYDVLTGSEATLAQNATIEITTGMTDELNYYTLTGCARISATPHVKLGILKSGEPYSSGYVEIDGTDVVCHTPVAEETLQHGLTFSEFIQISIQVDANAQKALLVINTVGDEYKHEILWRASAARVEFKNLDSTAITDAKVSYTCRGFNKKIWAFGDSYFNFISGNLAETGCTEIMLDAQSGRTSAESLTSLNKALTHATPDIIYWAMGMNDGDNGAVNSSWHNSLNTLRSICTGKNIKLVLATIPSVPNVDNSYKNAVVEASGYDYVDQNHAVGADLSTSWFTGLLSSDGVHPTAKGVNAIVQEVTRVMPYIKAL